MIWINYLIRVPVGIILGTFLIICAALAIILLAIFVNWDRRIGELATLPADWLDMVKTIGGLNEK